MTKPEADPITRFNTIWKVAFVLALLLGAYNLWSFFNSSRYQALCGASYWELSRAQLDGCLEQKQNLEGK
ncbi:MULTISPECIES: hypothetical protein [Methylocystis]|uniref:Uncharacterized protein n=1 Tax=Methylocystis iwaonis TaxID=2885079 RepID=A0ABN6VI97_9HYPH|nr:MULTISPECIES: hypothetical protein [Methylocystis]MBL1258729.1 hypothetical protein [Methylocystis sp. Sn-Cys]BDV35418.1 hypothetical protein SS37A_29470 [Methylocystis iwaonis]